MRLLAMTAILLSASALACPAIGQDRNFYVGGDIGVASMSDPDFDFTPGIGAGTTGTVEADTAWGYQAALFAGYDFGRYRVELEALRTQTQVDEINAVGVRPPGQPGHGTFNAEGEIKTESIMANVVLDFASYRGFELFAGAGLGVSHVEVAELATSGNGVILDDSETLDVDNRGWRTTWQVSAGARRALTDRIDVHLRYRYMRLQRDDDFSLVGFGGRVVELDALPQHSVTAGLSFRF